MTGKELAKRLIASDEKTFFVRIFGANSIGVRVDKYHCVASLLEMAEQESGYEIESEGNITIFLAPVEKRS